MTTDQQLHDQWLVVINDEEQYSIWPAGRDVPGGWHAVGETRDRSACLAHIEEVWTDMRPKSLRDRIAARSGHDA
ncbi:MbtH family protein [Pseudonocardia alni]|uniref:MbtH protein n=1 Tax=Pseudonocardia alni TaxID=33907 RepID=A0A852WJA2_PSEA5|nr:MbtH family NRPS accessory protein [Pseudonocardia antarctica]NYG05402.1 MbtH protein [Pseudonocardia antarctica]